MSVLKYKYALNSCNEIVDINTISEDCRNNEYLCPGCGRPMSFVIQKKHINWSNYFRHKEDGVSCHPNAYLHRLAEIKIKERFDDRTRPFKIGLKSIITCSADCEICDKAKCSLEAEEDVLDLHDWYDTCTLEKRVNPENINGSKYYVADLLLSQSKNPENKPILIEVWVTHENSISKKNSGLRIIEVKIPNNLSEGEKTIKRLCEDEIFAAGEISTIKNFNPIKKKGILNCKNVLRVDVFASGKLNADWINCNEIHNKTKKWTVVYSVNVLFNRDLINTNDVKNCISHILQKKGVALEKYCSNCFFCMQDYSGILNICKRYKTKGTPHYPNGNEATFCPFFSEDKDYSNRMESLKPHLKFIKVADFPKEVKTVFTNMTEDDKRKKWEEILQNNMEENSTENVVEVIDEEELKEREDFEQADMTKRIAYENYKTMYEYIYDKRAKPFTEWEKDSDAREK
ncbi:MAG: hypothetical protein MJZ83_05295 [Bacteroidaceae bacterium]|nr:hypothetical protein [Bacteroidaceae bacterium]